MKIEHVIALIVLGLTLAAGTQCTRLASARGAVASSCLEPSRIMSRLELLFGTARADAAPVSEGEWSSFVDKEVTPRFPSGLTVLSGPGQWRGDDGALTKERTNIVVVWHEPSPGTNDKIESIRSAYKLRFAQESVMRVDSLSCVSF